MKELSTEEKAQAYDEALKRAKILYNDKNEIGYANAESVLEEVFPLLKESEDERIRKELIEHIKANECVDYVLFKKFSPDDVIAWLEKQKPADKVEPKFKVYNEVLSFLDTLEVKEMDLEKEATEFVQTKEFVESKESPVLLIAKYFFELGLKAQSKDMIEALRTEYEKGRADVIAKTLEWINAFNDNNYIMQYSDSCEHPINEIIEWYKNYINRE